MTMPKADNQPNPGQRKTFWSASHQMSIYEYAPHSSGAIDYAYLVDGILYEKWQ